MDLLVNDVKRLVNRVNDLDVSGFTDVTKTMINSAYEAYGLIRCDMDDAAEQIVDANKVLNRCWEIIRNEGRPHESSLGVLENRLISAAFSLIKAATYCEISKKGYLENNRGIL